MAEQEAVDTFGEARQRAKVLLDRGGWPSFTTAIWALVSVTFATGTVFTLLVNVGALPKEWVVPVIVAVAVVAGPGVWAATEIRRFYEHAVCLRELFNAQKNYEDLIRTAYQEAAFQRELVLRLQGENEAIRAVFAAEVMLNKIGNRDA